jgi:hypothetical protein
MLIQVVWKWNTSNIKDNTYENYVSYDHNCTIDKFIVFIEHFKCISFFCIAIFFNDHLKKKLKLKRI